MLQALPTRGDEFPAWPGVFRPSRALVQSRSSGLEHPPPSFLPPTISPFAKSILCNFSFSSFL